MPGGSEEVERRRYSECTRYIFQQDLDDAVDGGQSGCKELEAWARNGMMKFQAKLVLTDSDITLMTAIADWLGLNDLIHPTVFLRIAKRFLEANAYESSLLTKTTIPRRLCRCC